MLQEKPSAEKSVFRVGDTVSFALGRTQRARGVVVEDRGAIGAGGRRLYGVRFQISEGYGEPQYIELPAAQIRKETGSTIAVERRKPTKSVVSAHSFLKGYKPTIHVGQRVRWRNLSYPREGTVIEDRGPLGGNGRQVVRIRYFADYAGDGNLEPVETETAAENVEVIP